MAGSDLRDDDPASGRQDSADLAAFGYRQGLHRTLGGFSNFAAGFSYLSILTGVPQLFYLGYAARGPSFLLTWPVILVGQMLVACCFAELAAEFPLSGGVYQWASRLGRGPVGWLAGWIALACAVVSMASVALAWQGVLPALHPAFHWVGSADDPTASARNAVLLGLVLVALCTLINLMSVRVVAWINNVGVAAELVGATLLVILLCARSRRGVEVVFDVQGTGADHPLGAAGLFLMAALVPSFVMYGFDTASSLAEETVNPRKHGPRAILWSLMASGLMGALVILGALLAAPNLADPDLGRLGGGIEPIIRSAIGPTWGNLLLLDIVLAVFVCALTVQAAAVRMIFAMARDNGLPWSGTLAALASSGRPPRAPVVVVGLAAAMLLLANLNSSAVVGALASVAVVWANLGYLLVTVPQLVRRWRADRTTRSPEGWFTLGRWGLPINLLAVIWSVGLVTNVGWPRAGIYGEPWGARLAAVWGTLALVGVGLTYYLWVSRFRNAAVVSEHCATEVGSGASAPDDAIRVDGATAMTETAETPRPFADGPTPTRRDKPARVAAAAWFVHLYTAIGLVFAAWIAVLLVQGGANAYRWSFLLMVAASLVDATDGTLARRFRVKSVLPGFDGRKLDDLIDFLTYTCLPLLLVWRAGLYPAGFEPWLLLPLLASAYGFCQVDAKTEDGYFLGFPSLWNVVALYLYVLQLPPWWTLGLTSALALMTFVPTRYLYPSLGGRLNAFSNIISTPWVIVLLVVLWRLPTDEAPEHMTPDWWLAVASLYYPAFYMVASWIVSFRLRRVRIA